MECDCNTGFDMEIIRVHEYRRDEMNEIAEWVRDRRASLTGRVDDLARAIGVHLSFSLNLIYRIFELVFKY